ncbi:MAG: right-handed parallel beta-helix repeat-containing protein [Planctomycetota bacterium]|jgi:parallel beta-helix repeat protein
MRLLAFTVAVGAAVLCHALPVSGGPLSPPGAPSSTYKTLTDVEPRKALYNDFVGLNPIVIAETGSYYLAENIDAIHSEHGIQILAPNVTLDLNGFTITGNTEVGSLDGVNIGPEGHNATILNGTIQLFFGDGIGAEGVSGVRVEGVHCLSNGDKGIVTGSGAIVRDCVFDGNSSYGAFLSSQAIVENCIAVNTTTFNGFNISGGVIRGCTAKDNGADGFSLSGASVAENCTSSSNDQNGFEDSLGSVIRGCTASTNGQAGFDLGGHTQVINSVARGNVGNGFVSGFESRIEDCTADGNGSNGIFVGSTHNTIIGNHVSSNSSAGIDVPSNHNVIDANHVTNDIIHVSGDQNSITRNISYVLVPPAIIDLGVGNVSGGSSINPSTAGPWANIRIP